MYLMEMGETGKGQFRFVDGAVSGVPTCGGGGACARVCCATGRGIASV